MKIALYTDNTLSVPLDRLVDRLNNITRTLRFHRGAERFYIPDAQVRHPATYKKLPKPLQDEMATYRLAVLATSIPYDNNYFFSGYKSGVIVSFSGWNQLTDLPITNGIVYFIASMVLDLLRIGQTHQKNRGCLNDYWWDKSGVNSGMRGAFICPDCRATAKNPCPELDDVDTILDNLSRASRMGRDVLDVLSATPSPAAPVQQQFDVFLCHNSQEKPSIRKINDTLKKAGIRTWLDEEQLPLGLPWQVELEKRIADIRVAAVFVGDTGLGPWQDMELRAFLSQFVKRGIPVIPVVLPEASTIPDLPLFLQAMTWLDLRQNTDQGLSRLVQAIQAQRGK
jgi:hypothetical protein